jgi:hypothetical protein
MDADSHFPNINGFFASITDVFNKNPDVVGATTWFRIYPRDETFSDRLIFKIMGAVSLVLNNYLGLGCACGGEFQMIRTDSFRQIGGYKDNLIAMEDLEMFSRLRKIGRIYFEKRLFIYHSGRRAHILGWSHSIANFIVNSVFLLAFIRVRSSKWEIVR